MSLGVWHSAYLSFLLSRDIPMSIAVEMTESVTETAEAPAVVAQRHLLEDLSKEL